MRKTAKYILDYCIDNDIGAIVVGHNKGWKQEINIGKKNNQNFVQVPFGYLMSMLESKCEEYGLMDESQKEIQRGFKIKLGLRLKLKRCCLDRKSVV